MTLYFKWDVYDVQVPGRIGMGVTHVRGPILSGPMECVQTVGCVSPLLFPPLEPSSAALLHPQLRWLW